ncbi:hypothetical protein [Snuella sedimenti]|uniref:T9SS type A sorting domain-containing protein n=1 Tax=Snuella sedimenti TaxID=2798802 RepID=A0A8J7LST8_9FLAO|nr:hypothetical protein [Snuella sedimenti]MBJ6367536.1 hypothetical protein [Snuella sedimenti]
MKRLQIYISTLFIFFFSILKGQSIYTNPITDTDPSNNNPYTTGETIDTNITGSGIGRGSGLNPPGVTTNDRYNARSWELLYNANDYFYITISPNACYEIDFTSFVFNSQTSLLGPLSIEVRSSIDGYTSSIGSPTTGLTETLSTIDLTGSEFQNINATITFRIYAWGATNGNGTYSINDFTFNGSVSPSTTTTWGGSSWDNGAPDISTTTIMDGDYNTSVNGNFSACNLTVNSGSTLTVNNSTYIEVENDITVDGNIIVKSQGAVIQNNSDGNVTVTGSVKVEKETAPINAWYEYTYWSAPVSGETIGAALGGSQPDRRFYFNAQNYLDATKETNNDNSATSGQDDIDDNGDDWQLATDSTNMTPGVGYISTHSKTLFDSEMSSPPHQFEYEFSGPFNNGNITVPIYRNDSELSDTNWNLVGNPYPSAIDADSFLAANSSIDGAVYLWSQNTAPSSTNNGNQAFNFSNSDYAIINGSGETAGGDGVAPNRTIPSCQGFFVSYSNSGTVINTNGNIKEGEINFNNTMRIANGSSNGQFFKTSNKKNKDRPNKLWIDLTSDSGIFSQVLVSYLNGASDYDDGSYYDAPKFSSKRAPATLYTTIKNCNKRFTIQGKALKSLNRNEIIALGFSTNINTTTLYKLSITKLKGAFLQNHNIYLKDKLLNKLHNLSESNYLFTSEKGVFNKRFEIVFKSRPKRNSSPHNGKAAIKVLSSGNGRFSFNTPESITIRSMQIFDLHGRQLYHLKDPMALRSRNVQLNKKTIYVVKLELSNGDIVTKKIVKN